MRLKNRIKRAAPVLGGKFTTHTYIHGENGWLDAHFLGTKPLCFIVWHCRQPSVNTKSWSDVEHGSCRTIWLLNGNNPCLKKQRKIKKQEFM